MNISAVRTRWRDGAPYVLSALRMAAAFLFLQFGTAKWFAFPGSITPGSGTVPLASLVGLGAILEVVGGTLMLIGLFTRPVTRNEFGIADHDVVLPTGVTVHNPIRVIPNGTGSTVTFTVIRMAGVSDQKFNEDAKAVEKDLLTLKALLEKR